MSVSSSDQLSSGSLLWRGEGELPARNLVKERGIKGAAWVGQTALWALQALVITSTIYASYDQPTNTSDPFSRENYAAQLDQGCPGTLMNLGLFTLVSFGMVLGKKLTNKWLSISSMIVGIAVGILFCWPGNHLCSAKYNELAMDSFHREQECLRNVYGNSTVIFAPNCRFDTGIYTEKHISNTRGGICPDMYWPDVELKGVFPSVFLDGFNWSKLAEADQPGLCNFYNSYEWDPELSVFIDWYLKNNSGFEYVLPLKVRATNVVVEEVFTNFSWKGNITLSGTMGYRVNTAIQESLCKTDVWDLPQVMRDCIWPDAFSALYDKELKAIAVLNATRDDSFCGGLLTLQTSEISHGVVYAFEVVGLVFGIVQIVKCGRQLAKQRKRNNHLRSLMASAEEGETG